MSVSAVDSVSIAQLVPSMHHSFSSVVRDARRWFMVVPAVEVQAHLRQAFVREKTNVVQR